MEKNSVVKKIFGIIGAILFFASYLPYFMVIYYGITGTSRGLFGGPYIYGFESMFNILTWYCVIPIIPVCFIYQVIFGIVYIRKHKALTISTLLLVTAIITAFISVGLVFETSQRKQLREDSDEIRYYLEERYGSDMVSGINITFLSAEDRIYYVTTPILPEGAKFAFYIKEDHRDDLADVFETYNKDYHKDFISYLNQKFDLPDNMTFKAVVEFIDFGDYEDGDDYSVLFSKTQYRLIGIEADTDTLNDDVALDLLNSVWQQYSDVFESEDFFTLYITFNGQYVYNITISYSEDKTSAKAFISTYSDYDGYSDLRGMEINLTR